MKAALMVLVFKILARQASVAPCNSSGLPGPMVVTDTYGATQLAETVSCSDGHFFVDWIGQVTLAGVIEIGANSTLEISGAENGSSYINGSGHTGLFQTTGGTLHLHDLTLANGTSPKGGAIYATDGAEVIVSNCTFVGNNATINGGAIYATGGAEVVVSDCTFVGNNASLKGGAIHGLTANFTLLGYTSFNTNFAVHSGGAIMGVWGSIYFEGSTFFKGNEAGFKGGGVRWWGDNSYVEVLGNVIFEGNKAYEAGGLKIEHFAESVVHGTMTFDSNTAISLGGGVGIEWGSFNFSATSSVHFSNNNALNGGAMGFENSYLYIDGDVTMESNTATSSGGAVYSLESKAVELKNMEFSSNFAEQNGGAIAMISGWIENTSTIWNCSFKDNEASNSGGAVYVTGGAVDISSSNFITNTAGENGGAIAMVSTGLTERTSTIQNSSFEDNDAGDSGGALYVVGGVVDTGHSNFTANTVGDTGGAIHTSGITSIDTCVFEENTAYYGTAVSTAITSALELELIRFGHNNLLCDTDFFLDWSNGSDYDTACYKCENCANCSIGNTTQVELCTEILDNTVSPLPNGTLATLKLDEGYWRSSERSKNILECYHSSACVGGSNNYCKTGYFGPFCAVCTDGYARGLGYTCFECNEGRRSVAIAIAAAALVVILALGAYGMTLLRSGHYQETRQGLAGLQPQFRMARASQALKIIIVAWQIVTQFSSVASVTYPGLYEKFLAVVDVFNFNLGWIFSAGCIININFYTNLLVATIGPLIIMGLISTSYIFTSYKRRESDPEAGARGEHRHGSAIFWISFLIYTTASSAVFRTFACDDLDTGKSYLRADHSLECYTSEHHTFVGYASVMMVIYPIGIPVCYALVLYRSRKALKMEQDREEDTSLSMIKDLWKPYRPKAYYYEVIECLRRVTLSGVVVFVYPNTAGQVAVTFLLTLFFFAVMMLLDPYANNWDAWLARLGHAIVMISMFVALLLKVDLSDEEILSQDVFAGVLIAGNCAMVLVVVAEAIGTCFVAVRELAHPIAEENDVRQASIMNVIPALDSQRVLDVTESPPPYACYVEAL